MGSSIEFFERTGEGAPHIKEQEPQSGIRNVQNLEAVINEGLRVALLGTDKVVITGMYRFDYSDRKAVEDLAKDLNASGERLAKAGIGLLYHNHNCEFRKVEKNRTAYDMLIEETDSRYVNFELDSYWPTEAGVSAIALIKGIGHNDAGVSPADGTGQ